HLDGHDAEFPSLSAVLVSAAEERAARFEQARAAGLEVKEPDGPVAVVVPLLAGPDNALLRRIRQAVMDSRVAAELTDVLGPHPLLAEALHVRLSEAGLARADRARLFTVATAADGIILASVGGDEAVQAAGITGMLLAARLAVPVIAAALDEEGSIASVAEQLRSSGSQQLALAPYLIGPEIEASVLVEAAKEADCSTAEPLGPYPAIGKLALAKYTTALGISPQQPQGTPVR
ncbi:sirohydrochlorin chelatase, partial [Streptomyces sp. NPDC057074]|uniref:sirohydrochlorin chelatase n=1 Tax=Streptomyces sp. NPDC057074 TaxID=3346015 RepID=UPI003629FE57